MQNSFKAVLKVEHIYMKDRLHPC